MGLYPNRLYGSLLDSSFQAPGQHGANSQLPNSYNAGFCFSLSYVSIIMGNFFVQKKNNRVLYHMVRHVRSRILMVGHVRLMHVRVVHIMVWNVREMHVLDFVGF
jgi:hypothetical protein